MSVRWPLTFALVCQTIGGKKLKIFGDAEKRSGWGMPCGLTVERYCGDRGWITWCER